MKGATPVLPLSVRESAEVEMYCRALLIAAAISLAVELLVDDKRNGLTMEGRRSKIGTTFVRPRPCTSNDIIHLGVVLNSNTRTRTSKTGNWAVCASLGRSLEETFKDNNENKLREERRERKRRKRRIATSTFIYLRPVWSRCLLRRYVGLARIEYRYAHFSFGEVSSTWKRRAPLPGLCSVLIPSFPGIFVCTNTPLHTRISSSHRVVSNR